MKVAFYTPTASGGHAWFTQCMMEGIQAAAPGLDLVLCTSEDLAPSHRKGSYRIAAVLPALRPRKCFNSKIGWALSRLWHYPRRDRLFLEWVGKERPDVVHLQEWFPFGAAYLVRRLQGLGAKVIVSVHNLKRHEQYFPWHSHVQAWFEKSGWRRADRLVVMSPDLASELCEVTRITHDKVCVVPHFVWPGGSEVSHDVAQRKRGMRNVLLFGAIRRNKGVELFIDALARTPDLQGMIVGYCPDASYSESLRTRIRQSRANVIYENRYFEEDEISGLFSRTSVAVFPYTSFGSQSGALFLAVANETPVVGTRVGALGTTIDHYGLGLAVDPGDPTALAEALRAIHEPDSYLSAVDQAKRLKETQSILAIGAQLAEIYHQL
jgi:glycosyltransferase involved in cell wall biosynthesis